MVGTGRYLDPRSQDIEARNPACPLRRRHGVQALPCGCRLAGRHGAAGQGDGRRGGGDIFEEFKGSLTEQHVCQQFVSDCGLTPYYWSAGNSSGEIDFLVQSANSVYAIEVKAEENLRAKSLRACKTSHPRIKSVRFSLSGYREQDWMRNVLLYAMPNMGLWG